MISRARYIQRSKLRALNATFTASLPQLQQDTEPRRAANVQARGTAASWLPQLCTLNSLHYSIPVSLCVCSLLLTLSRCLSICISILLCLARSSLSHSLSPPLSICLSISLSLSLYTSLPCLPPYIIVPSLLLHLQPSDLCRSGLSAVAVVVIVLM